jgi:hypothetical protein
MDSGKYTKLLNYSLFLEKQGNQFEKENEETEAIPTYIKMVDVLLLLAEAAPDYPSWQRYTGKAESYQKRIKVLISKASAKANDPKPQATRQPVRTIEASPTIARK